MTRLLAPNFSNSIFSVFESEDNPLASVEELIEIIQNHFHNKITYQVPTGLCVNALVPGLLLAYDGDKIPSIQEINYQIVSEFVIWQILSMSSNINFNANPYTEFEDAVKCQKDDELISYYWYSVYDVVYNFDPNVWIKRLIEENDLAHALPTL